MISDVLQECVDGLDYYLGDRSFDHVYTGKLRLKLALVRAAADELLRELDAPQGSAPKGDQPLSPLWVFVRGLEKDFPDPPAMLGGEAW